MGKREETPIIRVRLLKRRRRKVKAYPKLGGQWKEKEKFLLLGGQWKEKEKFFLLGGQWKEKEKFLLLGGQWKEKEKVPFYLFLLSPQVNLLTPSLFIL
jgi:hypothetical protein